MKTDLNKIKELDDLDVAASKVQDFKKLLTLWDENGVALPPGSRPVMGIGAISEWLGGEGESDYKFTEYVHDFMDRKIVGEWAFEWGRFTIGVEPIGEGSPMRSTGNLLRILRRQADGEWKVSVAIWNTDPSED